jgi:uncharacterized RDD family membrane protein YckC
MAPAHPEGEDAMQTPPPPPPPPVPGTTAPVEYAGFWRRVGAILIDFLLLSLVAIPLNAAFGDDPMDTNAYLTSPAYGISAVIQWLYFALMESSSKQATLGKMAIGIRVTDLEGNRIGFGRATGRYFAKILSALIIGIGFLMAAFTQRKQALHDLIAGTLVVR